MKGQHHFCYNHMIMYDVDFQLYLTGNVVSEGSAIVSTYMLMIVGLRFPLSSSLSAMFKDLEFPLHLYTPSTI